MQTQSEDVLSSMQAGSEVTVDIRLHQQQEVTGGGTDDILLVVVVCGCVFITDTVGFFSPFP